MTTALWFRQWMLCSVILGEDYPSKDHLYVWEIWNPMADRLTDKQYDTLFGLWDEDVMWL